MISFEKFQNKVLGDFNIFALDKTNKNPKLWKIITINGKIIKAILLLNHRTIQEFYEIDGKNYFESKPLAQKELEKFKNYDSIIWSCPRGQRHIL